MFLNAIDANKLVITNEVNY